MASKLADDPRIDPRIKAMFGAFPSGAPRRAANRDELVAAANTPEALAALRAGAVRSSG